MVKKIHTRRQRYMPIRSGRNRKARPKSFTSEAQAQAWATKNGVTNFTLKNLKNTESQAKKLVIVQK